MPRGNTEIKELFRARALSVGGVTRFDRELPVGEGWNRLILRFNHVVTIGTGTGPLSEGGLRVVRGVTLRTDRGDFPINGVPGRALYRFDQYKVKGAGAFLDAIAASSSTFRAIIEVWFTDPLAARPMDTVLDTARHQLLTLEVSYGTVADLYGTVGTSSVAPTLDCYIERTRGPLPRSQRPLIGVEYGVRVPVDPTTTTEILVERAQNLSYRRWLAFAGNVNTASGVPFSGDAANAVISEFTVDHDQARPWENVLMDIQREINKQEGAYEAALTGQAFLDFMRDGSIMSQLYSGDKSRLSLKWVNGTLGAVPQVSLAYEATRPLK